MKTRIYYNGGTENENGGGDQKDTKATETAPQPAAETGTAAEGQEGGEPAAETAE